jgi:hypothetical protein
MAIFFDRIPQDMIGAGKDFTHVGLIHGFVPVYIGKHETDCPVIAVRNGWPDWLEPVGRALRESVSLLASLVYPDFEDPGFVIHVQGIA